jgi:transposase
MADDTIRCPGCGQSVELGDAKERGESDQHAVLTCPTCGAGFDRDGNLVHDPAIGP